MKIFSHQDTDIVLVLEQGNKGDILSFYVYEDGYITEPYATLTLTVPHCRPLNALEFPIKNYSENEGLLEILKQNDLGYISGSVATGFVVVPIFQFNKDRLNEVLYQSIEADLDFDLER